MAQTKKNKDRDGDGKISFQEFIGDRGRDQSKDWLVTEKERFDVDLDRNKDGSLDDVEIGSWIIPSNDEIAQVGSKDLLFLRQPIPLLRKNVNIESFKEFKNLRV